MIGEEGLQELSGTAHRFTDCRVVVTGGSSGIGRATALAFADEGSTVVAVGRDEGRLADLAEQAVGQRLSSLITDLRDVDEASAVIEKAIARLGGIDVLVNCAGMAAHEPLLDVRRQTWDEIMAVNLDSPFFMSQAAARHMVAHRGGAIINVASIDAMVADVPYAHYSVSKAALVMMTKAFAYELGAKGVRCNAVAPGVTRTPMTDAALMETGSMEDANVALLQRIPLGRAALPEEQAQVILFLASKDASFINGETVVVDGGQLQGYTYGS